MTFTSPHIGQRIRAFRKLKGFTQQQLELELNASFGHISKIESGKVNPTKETILAIAHVLDLSNRELDYLIGITAEPATQEEIDKAIAEIDPYFKQKGIVAYLLDDRWRFLKLSDGFLKLFGFSPDHPPASNMIGKTTLQALTDENLAAKKYFSPGLFDDFLIAHAPYYYAQTHFMTDDLYFIESAKLAKKHPLLSPIWQKLENTKDFTCFNPQDVRTIYFQVGGFKIKTKFSRESLMTNSRFEVVEYTIANRFLRTLTKLNRL